MQEELLGEFALLSCLSSSRHRRWSSRPFASDDWLLGIMLGTLECYFKAHGTWVG